ncbi:hypothetical protein [Kitasatospora sp. NPDC127116]|uniref:hypothetical protein n=1 Tax=Kitasatospora sp. NPDC127116 TaxID=3345367 RepID=UPI0036376D88
MPANPTLDAAQSAVARASSALREVEELADSMTAEEAAEVLQNLTLQPGPAHRLAAAVTALGNQLASQLGDQPHLWEPVLEGGSRITAAAWRAAAPTEEVLVTGGRRQAAIASSPAIRAAGPGAEFHLAPAAVAPHSRIVEPPRR